jgi:hypothetical protein
VAKFRQIFGYRVDGEEDVEEQHERPPWIGPPEDELGICALHAIVLGRSEAAVVALRHVTVYSTGLSLDVVAVARGLARPDTSRLFGEQHLHPGDEPTDRFLRIGIEDANGGRASNLGFRPLSRPEDHPNGPFLTPTGASGGSAIAGRALLEFRYWIWPIPPAGVFSVFAEWPAFDVELSRAELDADAIADAGHRFVRLWDT